MYEYACMRKCVCVGMVYTYVQTKVIIGIACDMTIYTWYKYHDKH